MAHSKFCLDGPAFENCTRQVIRPDHVMLLQEEEVTEARVDNQNFQGPSGLPGIPAPQEERGEQAVDAPENLVLKCILEDACDRDRLRAFQEYEHYSLAVNPESECDVPEDELTDGLEDTSDDDGDQLVPVNLQLEEGPAEGDHDHPRGGHYCY